MVGTSSRPSFIEFALCRVPVHVVCFVGVDPRSKSVEPIGIDGWVQEEDHVFEIGFDFIGGSKMVGRKECCIGSTRFISMDGVTHKKDHRHVGNVYRGGRVPKFGAICFDLVQFGQIGRSTDGQKGLRSLLVGAACFFKFNPV